MASAINNATFEFNMKELDDWSKVIHELGFANPELTKLHTVDEGISHDEQIIMSSSRGLLGKKITGCTPSQIAGVTLSEKRWAPVLEDFRLTHCSADVDTQDKLVNQYKRVNPDFYDIIDGSQSAVGAFLVASVLMRFNEEILRKIWFNAKNTENVTDGGNLTNGTDVDFFNSFDGLWYQIFNDAVVTASRRFTVTKNAAASYALQALAADDGIAILRGLWAKADPRLRSHPKSQIMVTSSVYQQYMNDLEKIENTGAGNTSTTENGRLKLTFRGKEVIEVQNWDITIEDYYDNGTKLDKPHRAVLSTPDNLRVGTTAKDDFGTLEAFYDKVTKMNYIDGAYGIDAKMMEAYLIAVAY